MGIQKALHYFNTSIQNYAAITDKNEQLAMYLEANANQETGETFFPVPDDTTASRKTALRGTKLLERFKKCDADFFHTVISFPEHKGHVLVYDTKTLNAIHSKLRNIMGLDTACHVRIASKPTSGVMHAHIVHAAPLPKPRNITHKNFYQRKVEDGPDDLEKTLQYQMRQAHDERLCKRHDAKNPQIFHDPKILCLLEFADAQASFLNHKLLAHSEGNRLPRASFTMNLAR